MVQHYNTYKQVMQLKDFYLFVYLVIGIISADRAQGHPLCYRRWKEEKKKHSLSERTHTPEKNTLLRSPQLGKRERVREAEGKGGFTWLINEEGKEERL